MLCSKSLSSSSTLRAPLLLGVAYARKHKTIQTTESMQTQSAHEVKGTGHAAQRETRPTTPCVEALEARAAHVKRARKVETARFGE